MNNVMNVMKNNNPHVNLEMMKSIAMHHAKDHNCNYNIIIVNPVDGKFNAIEGSTYEMVVDSYFEKERNCILVCKTDDNCIEIPSSANDWKLQLIHLGKEIELKGNKIIPIVELLKSQLRRIYGDHFEDDFSVKQIIIENADDPDEPGGFGVIAAHFGHEIGFTLNYKEYWKEFQLSCDDAKHLMIDQLEMFDQIRAWGFKI